MGAHSLSCGVLLALRCEGVVRVEVVRVCEAVVASMRYRGSAIRRLGVECIWIAILPLRRCLSYAARLWRGEFFALNDRPGDGGLEQRRQQRGQLEESPTLSTYAREGGC